MFNGYEWATFLRFWSETLEILVNERAKHDPTRSSKLLPKVILPVIGGTGIVMAVSFLERVILDTLQKNKSKITWVKLNNCDWAKVLGMNENWLGWPLIDALTRLRHCFAHEYGRATEKQLEPLRKINKELLREPVKISWKEREFLIGSFFSIESDSNNIILESSVVAGDDSQKSSSQIIRIILMSFLEELEKVGVVDLSEWKK